jgi:hypothetical protein
VNYYLLWFMMLQINLFETEIPEHYLSENYGGAENLRELSSVQYISGNSRESGRCPLW